MPVQQMRYHRPGWELTTARRNYQVWGPGKITHADDVEPTGKTRDHWAAAWDGLRDVDDSDLHDGDYRTGDSLDDVLSIFPKAVRSQFVYAIVEAGA